MAFGKKRKSKLDVNAIVEAHSDGDSSVPILNTNTVVPERENSDTDAAQDGIKKAEQQMKRDADLEAKYPHIVPGSIRQVPKGEVVGDTTSKGRVATITCVDCVANREVNCQDLFQVNRCVACTKTHNLQRMKDKRAARATARKAKSESASEGNGNGNAA